MIVCRAVSRSVRTYGAVIIIVGSLGALGCLVPTWPLAEVASAHGQETAVRKPGSEPTESDPVRLAQLRRELAARIERLEGLVHSTESSAGKPALVAASVEIKQLQDLDLVYLQHVAILEQIQSSRQDEERFRGEFEALGSAQLSPGTSISWLVWDDYRDRLESEEARVQARSADIELARAALTDAHAELDRADRRRRRALDDATSSKTETAAETAAELAIRSRLADLEATCAAAQVDLRRDELALRKAQYAAATQHKALLAAQVQRLKRHVAFSEADLEQRKQAMTAYAAELESRLNESRQRLLRINRLLPDRTATDVPAAAELLANAAAGDSGDAPSSARGSTDVDEMGRWSHDTLSFLRQVCHEEVFEIERRSVEFRSMFEAVNHRFRVATGQCAADELSTWLESYQQWENRLLDENHRLATRASELLQDLSVLHRELRFKSDDTVVETSAAEVTARAEYLEHLLRSVEFSQRHVVALRRVVHRFVDELREKTGRTDELSFSARTSQAAVAVWNYELMAVGDQSITVGKIVKGAFGFLTGLLLAATVSRLLGRRVLPRVGLNYGASQAFGSLSFYSLCVLFGVLSLELANVPLTAFTFLGGAAAIGVGFGSQNILNNFISGLILLAEQPIRVGDLIELDGVTSRVERIGARSTLMRTGANIEITVPNSRLLENSVKNLTLNDNRIRTLVKVGVAYGSPLPEVKRLLLDAARHPKVLDTPEPFVLLADFADSALSFELHFWVQIASGIDCRRIEGDIREAIEAAFRSTGICIAYPQCDLHVDNLRPLQIQVTRTPELQLRKAA